MREKNRNKANGNKYAEKIEKVPSFLDINSERQRFILELHFDEKYIILELCRLIQFTKIFITLMILIILHFIFNPLTINVLLT